MAPVDHRIIYAVRVRALHARPHFATALVAMHLVPRPGFGTMAVDRWGRCYIDPTMIGPNRKWSVEQAAGVLIHELGHWLRKHHERAAPIIKAQGSIEAQLHEKHLINRCEDMELNDDLLQEEQLHRKIPIPLPPNMPDGTVLRPECYGLPDNQLWETYYQKLKQKPPPELERDLAMDMINELLDCGSSAHGIPGDYELPPPNNGQAVGIRDAEGDLIRRAVAREIRNAAKGIGKVAAGWERWAEEILAPPQVPWEQELAAMVRNAYTMAQGMIDYSWGKPSRRGNFAGCIMPRLRRPVPEVAAVVDTSGSMSGDDLNAAVVEVDAICKSLGQRQLRALCCDAEAYEVQLVTSGRAIKMKGGGGTDMRVGIDIASRLGADVLVVFTDGGTPWPDEPPRGVEVVICLIGAWAEQTRAHAPSWAKRVLAIDSVAAAA